MISRRSVFALLVSAVVGSLIPFRRVSAVPPPAAAQSPPAGASAAIPATAVMEPEEFARVLRSKSPEEPMIFQVGFRFLYKEGHIPGAEYLGPSSKDDGLRQLRERVASVQKTRTIVLYCGCCPWSKCPNIKPAYEALRGMGFTQVRVLHIDENFGTNWVLKGYPTVKGDSAR